ncbi:MAG: choice-of-anchor J domain-containing protein [Acidobacteriota bacterium]
MNHGIRVIGIVLFVMAGILAATVPAEAQLINEGFEGATFPPDGWASFNGVADLGYKEWMQSSTLPHTGTYSAFIEYDNIDPNAIAEDWLVTPQLFPSATDSTLTFWMRQSFSGDYGTEYTIRVSTASQTTHADFTTIQTWVEADFDTTYSQQSIDLSAYIGQGIYVAFVMAQDDGDNWHIDDVAGVPVPVELMSFEIE